MCSESAAVRRDLPIPGSPEISTTRSSPAFACCQRRTVIGEATRRQVGGLFDLEDLGPQQLAGFVEPQHAWRVLSESDEVSRFEALRSGETPLVGREEEVELLGVCPR